MTEKRFKSTIDEETMSIMPYFVSDNEEECFYNLQGCVDLLNELVTKCHKLEKENEQLKSLVNACEYGQKNLMKEMKNNDEALDKIWEIMKCLYGVVDDE